MNQNEVERRLRAERGSREEGYVASRLPASLEDSRESGPRSSLLRAAVLVPGAVAGVLAVAFVATLLSGRAPSGSEGPSANASATSSPSVAGEVVRCQGQDLDLSVEPWGAAAGSRGTVVTIRLAAGGEPCLQSTSTSGSIRDADGGELVVADNDAHGRPDVLIEPGAAYTIGVAWSNWCGAPPARPVALAIVLADIPESFAILPPDGGGADPVPPCLGENEPSSLSITDLQPAP